LNLPQLPELTGRLLNEPTTVTRVTGRLLIEFITVTRAYR